MAPTETLAEQHFATVAAAAAGGESVRAALLTGSTPARAGAEMLGRARERRALAGSSARTR